MKSEPEGGQMTTPPKPDPEQDIEETVREMRSETPRPPRDRGIHELPNIQLPEEFVTAFETLLWAIKHLRSGDWSEDKRRTVLSYLDTLRSVTLE